MAKKKKILMKSKQRLERSDAAVFLRQLADKVESGAVSLTQMDEQLQLDLPEQVILEIEVEEKAKPRGTRQTLEIELEWMLGDPKPSHQPISLE